MQDGHHCLVEPVDRKPEVRVARVVGLPTAGKVRVKAINAAHRSVTLEKGTHWAWGNPRDRPQGGPCHFDGPVMTKRA